MDADNRDTTEGIKRFFGDFDAHSVVKSGVRIGDKLLIFPMEGRKKSKILNRTSYAINGEKQFSCTMTGSELILPDLLDRRFKLKLILCTESKTKCSDESKRYLLKSYSKIPFKVNGVFSFESFLERGDEVIIGHNKLKFINQKEYDVTTSAFDELSSRFINTDLDILLEGETGTGKSFLAKEIHQRSSKLGKFVHVNLSSFSENLIESELFGHKKGSFTGALHDRVGAFAEANNGTLFLDEIDSLPLSIQTKLLLFLDSKKFRSVGSNRDETVNVRLIFASGRQLETLVNQGSIRKDFFFRITSGVRLSLLPLRDRIEFIREICNEISVKSNIQISESLIEFYQKVSWPGNIRQLLGHLKKKQLITKSRKIEYCSLDEGLLDCSLSRDIDISSERILPISELKIKYAYKVFMKFGQNITQTSKILKITSNTLRSLLKKNELIS